MNLHCVKQGVRTPSPQYTSERKEKLKVQKTKKQKKFRLFSAEQKLNSGSKLSQTLLTQRAFTVDTPVPTQVFFENFYTSPTGNQLVAFTTAQNATATIAHENEHINDDRLGKPSSNDAGFNTAYLAGVAAYNAAAGHDPDIGANFLGTSGKAELFAELGAYWDTSHWGVTGVTPAMSSKAYTSSEVLTYFSSAWTYFQNKKTAGTW